MNKATSLINNVASALLVEANLQNKTFLEKHNILAKEAEPHSTAATPETKKALGIYTNKGYGYINNTLRGIPSKHLSYNKPNTFERIDHLKKLTQIPTKHSFKVYRGMKTNVHNTLNKGDIIHDKGFTSTSVSAIVAKNGFSKNKSSHKFIIHVKPGTKGHYAGHDNSLENSHEREFILHPGTRFKVGKKEMDNEGTEWTHLSIHSQED